MSVLRWLKWIFNSMFDIVPFQVMIYFSFFSSLDYFNMSFNCCMLLMFGWLISIENRRIAFAFFPPLLELYFDGSQWSTRRRAIYVVNNCIWYSVISLIQWPVWIILYFLCDLSNCWLLLKPNDSFVFEKLIYFWLEQSTMLGH